MFKIILIAVCFAGIVVQAQAQCVEKNGRYPVSGQCDAYIECVDGVAAEKLCPDGLFFNDQKPNGYPCKYPNEVSCENRGRTQAAQPTEDCPHQFGYYRLGDTKSCGTFKNCVDGKAFESECPKGLAFSSEEYRCDWPDQVSDCDAEAYLGFKCPNAQLAKSSSLGFEEQRLYKSPHDCHSFFLCFDGKPRLLACEGGMAFNEETNACDLEENVPGCH